MATKVLTVMFTDIKGFSERTSNSGRDFVVNLRKTHDSILKPIIKKYSGKLVKTIGDAFLLTFESPTNAVLCALMIQNELRTYNSKVESIEKIEIRIAINTGELSLDGEDILGEPVNVASRIESITQPNEIWFGESTYHAMNKSEVPNSLVGEFKLKGISEPLKVYRVVQDLNSEEFKKVVESQKNYVENNSNKTKVSAKNLLFLGLFILLLASTIVPARLYLDVAKRNAALENAQALASNKKFDEAIITLKEHAYGHKSIPDSEIINRISKYIEKIISLTIQDGNIDDAELIYSKYQDKFTFYAPSAEVESRIALARAHNINSEIVAGPQRNTNRETIRRIFSDLEERFPENEYVLLSALDFYSQSGINIYLTHSYVEKLMDLNPGKFKSNENVIEHVGYYLRTFAPDGPRSDFVEVIARYFYEKFADELQRALTSIGEENRIMGWHALNVANIRNKTIDPFPVYLNEFLFTASSEDNQLLDKALSFLLDDGSTINYSESIESMKLLESSIVNDLRILNVITGPLSNNFQTLLEEGAINVNDKYLRFNSMKILAGHEMHKDLISAGHIINVLDWRFFARIWGHDRFFLESLEYLSDNGLSADAAELLNKPLSELTDEIIYNLELLIESAHEFIEESEDRKFVSRWKNIKAISKSALNKLALAGN